MTEAEVEAEVAELSAAIPGEWKWNSRGREFVLPIPGLVAWVDRFKHKRLSFIGATIGVFSSGLTWELARDALAERATLQAKRARGELERLDEVSRLASNVEAS